MSIGFLLLLAIVFAYILIPPLFMVGSYFEIIRNRYIRVLGGNWSRTKHILFELGVVLVSVVLIVILSYLAP